MSEEMSEEIRIERTIRRTDLGLEFEDKLLQISGKESGKNDISEEFKEELWDDMSVDMDSLLEEFGVNHSKVRRD